jgi:Ca-activated chloride channel family protein
VTALLFAHPEWLAPLAAGGLALTLALAWAMARGHRRLRSIVGDDAARSQRRRARRLRDAAPLAAVWLLAVALLGPRIGQSTVELSTSGVDVVILIDTSRSMDARDIPPSRIDSARRAARRILSGLEPSDRAALAAFSGRGALLTPLTSDHAALTDMVTALDTTLVRPAGSDLARGVVAALAAFEPLGNRPRALFVLSDGESFGSGGEGRDGYVQAVRADTRVFAASIGSETGAVIPDHGAPLRDGVGQVVRTRRRTDSLRRLTQRTGGELFVADEWGHFDLDRALRLLRAPVANAPGEFVEHRVTTPVVLPFAALAATLLWLEWLPVSQRRSKRRPAQPGRPSLGLRLRTRRLGRTSRQRTRRRSWLAAAALVLLCCVLPAAGTPVSEGDTSAPTLVQRGLEWARRGAWTEAERSFLAAALVATDPATAALAYYNLGVAALQRDDFEAARSAFFDSLAVTGDLAATRDAPDPARVARTQFNLEWALARLREQREDELAHPPSPEARAAPPKSPTRTPDSAAAAPRRKAEPSPRARFAAHPARRTPEGIGPDAATDADDSWLASSELDADQRADLLARVADDPRRALRSIGLEHQPPARSQQRRSPSW